MSVYVSEFATWTVLHDDPADGGSTHVGVTDPSSIRYATMNGIPNPDYLVVTCPKCGATCTHPVGGGAHPAQVQELFVRMAMREGPYRNSPSAALADVRERCERMDYPGRWQVDEGHFQP